MVNFEIDNKKLDKERKKMEKEEQKLKMEQEKALKRQNRETKAPKEKNDSGETKFAKYKDSRTVKRIAIAVLIILLIVIAFLCRSAVTNYVNNIKNETKLQDDEVLMINIIGFDIESAKLELEKYGISYKIIYKPDNYNLPGNVIKTSANPGSCIKKDDPITIDVCENGELITELDHNIKTEATPFTKNGLDVLSFYTNEDEFSIVIQNNTNLIITEVAYTIGYENAWGSKIGDKIFKEFDLFIQPGEKYILTNNIKNNNAYSLTIERFDCSVMGY